MPDQPTYGDRTRDAAIFEAGRQQGLRQATEGWQREWGVDLQGHGASCVLSERDARGIAAGCPDHLKAEVFSRLVGPWKPAEQPAAAERWSIADPDRPHGYVHEVGYALCRLCSRVRDADVHQPEPAHGGTVATQEPAVHAEAPVDSDFDLRRLGLMRTPVVPLLPEPLLYEPVTQAEDDAHMRAMEERMEHEAEQGEGDDRG